MIRTHETEKTEKTDRTDKTERPEKTGDGRGSGDGRGNGDGTNGKSETSASTRFCWAYGGKEGREVFSLETTINGILSEAEIENHISSAIRAMGAVFRHGGRAKWAGRDS